MARTARDAKLETRTARLVLKPNNREPYWKSLGQGTAIGYYRGERECTWVARCRPEGKKAGYFKIKLGRPDDVQDADGIDILTFAQAQEAARKWFVKQTRAFNGLETSTKGYTVADAVKEYMAWFELNRKGVRGTELINNAFILPRLGDIALEKLTTRKVREWHEAIAKAPARLRSGKNKAKRKFREATTPEAQRRRNGSANRILTVLKAALNYAYREGRISTDDAWRRVKPFPEIDEPIIRFLTEAECARLINACKKDFRPLVKAALLTGARYGEIAGLKATDYNRDTGMVYIKPSKSGRGRIVPLSEEGRAFFEEITAGKHGKDFIFTKESGARWGTNHHARPLQDACKNGKITPAITFHDLRHSYASLLAQAGADLLTISKLLGHADTRVTSRHYAHLCDRTLANAVQNFLPNFGHKAEGKVKPIR
jgi:integrase